MVHAAQYFWYCHQCRAMKKILVYSRPAIEAIEPPTESHVVISINCPGEPPANIRKNHSQLDRVNLFFWDIDQIPESGVVHDYGSDTAFSGIIDEDLCQLRDAQTIIDMIEAHPEVDQILVHCTAGRSRSAAVAAALHKILNGSDEPIFGNAYYRPNMRVYRMILEEWYNRHQQ